MTETEAAMSSPRVVFSGALSDAGVRRDVLDARRSWMLQAPAGSGKTELLMQRYLACLATVEQPESVLAITFTRKAAAEMRARILRALERAQGITDAELASCPEHERRTLELASAALRVSSALGWKILEHSSRLQIRTLDSFCEAVAQRAPFRGQLGGHAQVMEDSAPLYRLAAQRVIDELAQPGARGEAVATLLDRLDNNVANARDLLAGMLARREQWLHFLGRSDVLDVAQQQELRAKLEAALALSVDEELVAIDASLSAVLNVEGKSEVVQLVRWVAAQQETGAELIPAIAASAALDAPRDGPRDASPWPRPRAAQLESWRAICDLLLTQEGSLRATVTKRQGFPNQTVEQRTWKERCITLLAQVGAHADAEQMCAALSRVRQLPEPCYTEPQWLFICAMLQLMPLAAANLNVVFSEQGSVDFAEYAQRAMDAIGEDGDPTELGLQLGYRIRHVLVDEFQDTNHVQVSLLSRLLRTWEADENCSAFYVGDPMQSIYAFRQADVAIYQQARRGGVGGYAHSFGRLTQNFRSQSNLVEWFNLVFPRILDVENEATNAVRYDIEVVPSRGPAEGDAVRIRGFAKGDRRGEARYLAECIRQELAQPEDDKPVSIAVLVRSRSHLPQLVEALREAGIRYRAVKTDRLVARPLVRDLEALRAALDDPADRTAWLSVLRAPWAGLMLAELLELCRGDRDSTLRTLLDARGDRLSARARRVLDRVLPVLDDALARRGRCSLRELVESTWLRLGGASCMAASQDAGQGQAEREQSARDAEAYFALLDAESSAAALADPESFARKLNDLYAPPDTSSGIQVEIMPIHQAKGLEWDVVFLPALDRRPRQDDKSLLYGRLRRSGEDELLLLGPMEAAGRKKDGKAATLESYMRKLSSGCAHEELKRLFYVAATRARKRLYLSAAVDPDREPASESTLRLLWPLPEMQQAFLRQEPAEQEVAADTTQPVAAQPGRLLRRLPEAYELPSIAAPLQWSLSQAADSGEEHRFEWVGELLPRVGVVAHSFLQRIATEGVERWDGRRVEASRGTMAAALLAAGVAPVDLEKGVARASQALLRTLEDERGRWLLSAHAEHRCEMAVSAVVDGRVQHIRVDRTFVEDGVRWLIDYKITEQQGGDAARFIAMQVEKYRPDMARYASVLALFDPRPVRCALYLPLLGAFCPVALD